jgi:uncharacterized protein YqgV (UPF0045/DUF77 family)
MYSKNKEQMELSVEITLTPLQDDFDTVVIDFIKNLRKSGLVVKENPLSTQVYGPYDRVMQLLSGELKAAFEALDHGLAYVKIVKGNRSGFEPHY